MTIIQCTCVFRKKKQSRSIVHPWALILAVLSRTREMTELPLHGETHLLKESPWGPMDSMVYRVLPFQKGRHPE